MGEPERPELAVWHEFLDQGKELSLLKPDVCVKQFSRPSTLSSMPSYLESGIRAGWRFIPRL